MRWTVFLIFAYLFLAVEIGLDRLLEYGGVSPSFLLILGVFVGLSAPRMTVVWTMLILGLLTDLTYGHTMSDGRLLWLTGPATLGYLCGALVVLQLRALVVRESAISLAVMVFVVGVFVHLVVVAILTLRGLPWPTASPIADWSAADELAGRFFELLYSAILALPLGFVLARTEPLFAFLAGKSRAHHHHRQR